MILFVRVCNTFCLDTFCPSYFQVNTFCPDTFCPTILMIYLLAHIDYVNWSNVYTWLLSQYKMPETKKHFLINSFSSTAFYVSPAEWKWMTCPFLLLPNSFLWYHGKYFYAERTPPPPNSPLVHIKSKWKKKKRMASVGEVGGLMEGDDR